MTEKDISKQSIDNENVVKGGLDENPVNMATAEETTASDGELQKIKAELAEANDRFIRKVAEFENFKRRNAKERIELIQTAGRDVISSMLEVLDDCDRAQKQLEANGDGKEGKEGVLLVFNKLRNILQAKGLKPMETLNREFDPDLHEAISEIPAPDPALQGKIVDEVMKGYYLNDKIIRHAKVVVGK